MGATGTDRGTDEKASSLFPNLATVNGGGGTQMATVVSIGAPPVQAEDPTNELDPDADFEGPLLWRQQTKMVRVRPTGLRMERGTKWKGRMSRG